MSTNIARLVLAAGVNSLLLVGGVVVFLLARWYPGLRAEPEFSVSRESGRLAPGIYALALALVTALNLAVQQGEWSASDLGGILIFGVGLLLPVAIALKWRHEKIVTLGFSTRRFRESAFLGVAAAVPFCISVAWWNEATIATVLAPWSLARLATYMLPIAIVEEALFRGYLQTRLMAWLGKTSGWIVAALLMAFFHLPHRYLIENLAPLNALISAAWLIPGSLLIGYLYRLTSNLAGAIILHALIDWALWM